MISERFNELHKGYLIKLNRLVLENLSKKFTQENLKKCSIKQLSFSSF